MPVSFKVSKNQFGSPSYQSLWMITKQQALPMWSITHEISFNTLYVDIHTWSFSSAGTCALINNCLICPNITVLRQLNISQESINGTSSSPQDRCYSYVVGESTVQKGCTRAENCIGNRICCQTDFCNAGYGAGW